MSKAPWYQRSPSTPYDRAWGSQSTNADETPQSNEWSTSWNSNTWTDTTRSGQPMSGAQMPTDFTPNDKCWDSRFIGGVPLLRQVTSTPWSRKIGIAGKSIETVNLADVSFRGWQELAIRHLSHGRYTSAVFTRSISESVFVTFFLQFMRDQKIELDSLAAACHHTSRPGTSLPDKMPDSKAFFMPLIQSMGEHFKQFASEHADVEAQRKVAELQAKLARYEAKGMTLSPVPQTPRQRTRESPSSASQFFFIQLKRPRVHEVNDSPTKAHEPHRAFKPDSSNMPLEQDHPSKTTEQAVKAWLNKFKRTHLDATTEKDFELFQDEVFAAYQSASTASKPDLVLIGQTWGLPPSLASKYSEKSLLGLIATAAYQAA